MEKQTPPIKNGTVGEGKYAIIVQLGFESTAKPLFYAETASKGHDKHHEKHAAEMGISFKEWRKKACDLLNAEPCDYYLDWYIPGAERFFRYDLRTSSLVVGDTNGNIKTYFKLRKELIPDYIPQEYLAQLRKKK